MLTPVIERTLGTLRDRWTTILGASIIPFVVLMLILAVGMPALIGTLGQSAAEDMAANASAQAAAMQTTDPALAAANGDGFAATGAPAPATTAEVPKPGMGAIMMVVVAMLLFAVISIAVSSIGVFAAAGSGVADSIRLGFTTSPAVVVQSLKLAWPALAAYMAAVVIPVLLGGWGLLLTIPLMLIAAVMMVRYGAQCMIAMGSIAHGHVTMSTDLTKRAVRGREWPVAGVGFVGSLIAGVIPIVGFMVMAAWMSAMWEVFGDNDEVDPMQQDPDESFDSVDAEVTAEGTTQSDAGASPYSAAAAAIAAPIAAVTTPATPSYVAGPTWHAVATSASPCGGWMQLAQPAHVAVTLHWVEGSAPTLMACDEAGAWTTLPEQPVSPGTPFWVGLGAGNTWLAAVPREPQQEISIATMVPDSPGAAAA